MKPFRGSVAFKSHLCFEFEVQQVIKATKESNSCSSAGNASLSLLEQKKRPFVCFEIQIHLNPSEFVWRSASLADR